MSGDHTPAFERSTTERASCGVGFVASLRGEHAHATLQAALGALRRVEHRGALAADGVSSDGAGVMADIPFDLIGHEPGSVAVATMFTTADSARRARALAAFEETFEFLGIHLLGYRDVPVNPTVLGQQAREDMPHIVQAILRRPQPCRTDASFNTRLYFAKQLTRTKLKAADAWVDLFFTSLSTTTVVYKALCRGGDLDKFYPDLANPRFKTRFALFHRRFSTNTRTSWDKAQPFRLIAHNGEINTVAGNRSWAYSREQAMGLARDELLTHDDISDSGNLNEMIEALKYRSSIPHIDDILAIMVPPADERGGYYEFWGRAMEPWDGPALIGYSNGETVGARLDRNGFRPARWCMTADAFYLASEAGAFALDESTIREKGTLRAGSGATVRLQTGKVHFRDPSASRENVGASFDSRLVPLSRVPERLDPTVRAGLPETVEPRALDVQALFGLTTEERDRILVPTIVGGKEPIGSMGDTARLAVFSDEPRSFYDYFFQNFAQVTNPPLDYLRETMVTDLTVYLGQRPNIFAPKELIPPAPGIRLRSPVLRLRDMQVLHALTERKPSPLRTLAAVLDCTFERSAGADGLRASLHRIAEESLAQVRDGRGVLILSHRGASIDRPPIPSLLALRSVIVMLNHWGARLDASVVLEAGDIRTTHELSCAVGFGATAVCPYLALEIARFGDIRALADVSLDAREERLVQAYDSGLLKVMSKVGISVVRSYQSSKLFYAVGVGPKLLASYFRGLESPLGGVELEHVAQDVLRLSTLAADRAPGEPLPSRYRLKEKVRGDEGERHSMTASRSKLVHDLVRGRSRGRSPDEILTAYEAEGDEAAPVSPRHLLDLRPADVPLRLDEVEPAEAIFPRFGSGAMSFGAISAEAQRDLFKAMRSVGARCNSGEGGENPYYYLDGTTATTKQVASGRFGVTAEYLVAGDEIEIKIAQGAKPGEGGQLMGVKVDEQIAFARHASPGVDLISPPPLHDIYSIEDLKQLIYELGTVAPGRPVCVKLVAGKNVGTIAAGVVKAGADIVQISGGDGGTGAAPLGSMLHAGLPWELGLVDVHRTLVQQGLRDHVRLRVDGGLSTARDIVLAALLGADEFGFGKLLLVAEGCIMARVCEKNRCPTGIATHDPKFKAKYKGSPEHVVTLLRHLAEGVRRILADVGARSLAEVVGQRQFLRADPRFHALADRRNLDLAGLLEPVPYAPPVGGRSPTGDRVDSDTLDARITRQVAAALEKGEAARVRHPIQTTDRAVLAGLSGLLATRSHRARMAELDGETPNLKRYDPAPGTIGVELEGSAGQGFAAFLVPGIDVTLFGEANDSVCKSMSGGRVVIRPSPSSSLVPEDNVIIGNCALYGATGGKLFVSGRAGDRFAVRNSGAIAVVEGAGLHACEYMTGGIVVILGPIWHNAGAGMTGGTVYLPRDQVHHVNDDYARVEDLDDEGLAILRPLLERHAEAAGSGRARTLLDRGDETLRATLVRLIPNR
jgi:glutamate synthase domain-containing protein 2/glutamate synthase domain-containing protein 1/glutamate synthase domain-containing protein 3